MLLQQHHYQPIRLNHPTTDLVEDDEDSLVEHIASPGVLNGLLNISKLHEHVPWETGSDIKQAGWLGPPARTSRLPWDTRHSIVSNPRVLGRERGRKRTMMKRERRRKMKTLH